MTNIVTGERMRVLALVRPTLARLGKFMTLRPVRQIGRCIALAGLLATYASAEDSPHPAAAIAKVGVLAPLSGHFARYGEQLRRGVESGSSADVALVFEDEGCLPTTAVSAYRKLTAADGIKIFLGPMCGSPQVALAPLIGASKQLAVLGAAAPERVYDESAHRMLSVQHSIEQESRFNAAHAYARGRRRAVIVFAEADYGRSHEKAFRESFQGEILETFAAEEFDIGTIRSIALRIRTLAPDLIYIPDAYPLLQGFLKGMAEQGVRGVEVFSVYSTQSDDVLKAVGPSGEGLIYSYPEIEGDEEALHYFPRLASTLVSAAVKQCGNDPECALSYLTTHNSFDAKGVLSGKITLKTIRNGRFARLVMP